MIWNSSFQKDKSVLVAKVYLRYARSTPPITCSGCCRIDLYPSFAFQNFGFVSIASSHLPKIDFASVSLVIPSFRLSNPSISAQSASYSVLPLLRPLFLSPMQAVFNHPSG
jgi:hypothetical protein